MEACLFSPINDIQKGAIFGLLMIDYLQKSQNINNWYYALNMHQIKEAIKFKRQGKLCVGVLLLQDSAASVHTAQVAVAGAERCGLELLSHAPKSPDLAPSDFYLSTN